MSVYESISPYATRYTNFDSDLQKLAWAKDHNPALATQIEADIRIMAANVRRGELALIPLIEPQPPIELEATVQDEIVTVPDEIIVRFARG